MLGNEAQRTSDVVEVPGDINLRRRLGDLLQETRVIFETPRNVQSSFHINRELFAMNVLAKAQHIQHAESELRFVAMLERQQFLAAIIFEYFSQTVRVF